eukprot:CAMPEP_0181325120 /NCGR_PEP_ID=MMETSP1101-20121128/20745_1 /TAXON_ID=46948 /ORGANISM="Rhodomonas abbreviata, Strain Caron Lab Isolate" /LENGTH=161 /DNA_ID=CAMNT_0023433385 /DNA_START=107 /DNA_END=592 /DNA_ORIENTATION=+
MTTAWKDSPNRGFYYGSSNDTPWNHEEAWRAYVNKTDQIDTLVNHKRMKEAMQREGTANSRGATSGSRMGSGSQRGTGSSTVGRKTVNGLLQALNAEQLQRQKKEQALEQLLLDETAARVKAESEIKNLERKYDHLVDRLAAPGMPLHGTKKKTLQQSKPF